MASSSEVKCKRFEGKVAVVTAATAGIGLAIAQRLGREGASVMISSRKQTNVDEQVQELRSEGITAEGCICHVAKKEHLKKLVQLTIEKFGKVDILISNAAVNPEAAGILTMSEAAIDKILEINIKSAILLIKEFAPHLKQGSCVVFVASYIAYNPSQPIAMYGVSKTALLGLTRALAEEMGPAGVRVNCIAPGTVPTKFASYLVETPGSQEALLSKTLLGRLGTPQDMAAATAFLASDDASYITGETVVIAGGMHCRL